jgi:hypothetical protein
MFRMKPTLCVYFTDTIAEKVAHLLHAPNVGKGLASTQEAIEDFVMNVEPTLYSAVIALGDYSGRDQDKLRLETTVNPAWRNTMLINYTKNHANTSILSFGTF